MFSIKFGYFLNNRLSFGFNIVKHIFLFLHVFDFQRLSPIFWPHYYIEKLRNMRKSQHGMPRGKR
jgi:hypothetical protein